MRYICHFSYFSKLFKIVFLYIVFVNSSFADENPLRGYWTVDQTKTIAEIELRKKPRAYFKLVECYKSNLCGNYYVYFGESEYYYIYPDGDGDFFKTSSLKYKIVRNGSLLTLSKWEDDSLIYNVHLVDEGYYVELDGFSEYFKRASFVGTNVSN